jgi:hypothetical protein
MRVFAHTNIHRTMQSAEQPTLFPNIRNLPHPTRAHARNDEATQEVFLRTSLFSGHFIDSKSFYLHQFGLLPSVMVIRQLDYEKAYVILRKEFAAQIEEEFHYSAINPRKTKEEKEESIILMKEQIVLEMGDGYVEIYHNNPSGPLYKALIARLSEVRGGERTRKQEISLITRGDYGLELSRMDIKRTKLDLDLYYEDNFKEIHNTILRRLNKKEEKGIVLLHGLPGTGKTTYLRYLVGKLRKRVLFVPPDLATQIVNPDLVRLLIDNPNTILVIEDAENIIMQRQPGSDSAVSNLLNISDGLLSDMLNVQIICTFNNSLNIVDNALLRKGRLIARYEFGALSQKKASALAQKSGLDLKVDRPLTISELFNHGEREYEPMRRAIGFQVGGNP